MDCSPSGSSVHGISQKRILEWVASPFSRGPSWPRDRTSVSCIAGRFFTIEPPGKPRLMLCQPQNVEFLCPLPPEMCSLSETQSRPNPLLHSLVPRLGVTYILSEPQVIRWKRSRVVDPCPVCLTGLTWGRIKWCAWSALETGKHSATSSKEKLIICQNSLSLTVLSPCSPLRLPSFLGSLCPTHLCSLHNKLTSLLLDLHPACFINSPTEGIRMGEKICYYCWKSQHNALPYFPLLVLKYIIRRASHTL